MTSADAPPSAATDDANLPELISQLRGIADPLRRLTMCRRVMDRRAEAIRVLRDERDALVYAGIDRFSTPGADPTGWRTVGNWRRTARELSGLNNTGLQRIERRRALHPDGGYWRVEGRGGTRIRRLPDVTADPHPEQHWLRVRQLNTRIETHRKAAAELARQIRTPALLEAMREEPSNLALEQPTGLTLKRLEQIRAEARAAGHLPPARLRIAS